MYIMYFFLFQIKEMAQNAQLTFKINCKPWKLKGYRYNVFISTEQRNCVQETLCAFSGDDTVMSMKGDSIYIYI